MLDILEPGKYARNAAQTAGSKTSNRQESESTQLRGNVCGDAAGAVGTSQEGRFVGQRRGQDWWWLGIDYNDIM